MSQLVDKATVKVYLMAALLCVITPAWSDDSQPLYVEVIEVQTSGAQAGIAYQVKWRIPSTVKRDNAPIITLPVLCQNITPKASRQGSAIQQRLYRCRSTLAGQPIGIRYTGYNPSISSLIKYRAVKGEEHTRLLSPSETTWTIPSAETKSRIARDYTLLGMQHIWAGTDHLLFLLCLLWIAGSWRRVLVTITGFTLAHSLTLALSALQWVRLPVPPVEAVIALSIVFLATEIVKDNPKTLTWRYPIAVSSSFGLLHGFGFAAALAEIGLPQVELVTGLLFFNVGVEIGQVVFAGMVLLTIVLLKRFVAHWLSQHQLSTVARQVSGYSIGGLASFWLVERCTNFIL